MKIRSVGGANALAAVLAGASLLGHASGQAPVQTFYVPLPEQDLLDWAFIKIYKNAKAPINSLTSIAIAADNTVIWYDHWEDGYDQDITNQGQETTEIWGDGDLSNGCVPNIKGVINPCLSDDDDKLMGGDAIVLQNDVPLPRDPSVILFDGSDKVLSSFPVAMTRGAFPETPGSYLAGAVEVLHTEKWGNEYVAPIGENVRSSTVAFQHTAAYVMFKDDRTTVTLPDGSTRLMYAGENLVVSDVNTGYRITADKPIQVDILAGDINSVYELRWYSLVPRSDWSNEYYSPVGTTGVAETRMWVYNPGTERITVTYEHMGGQTGTFTVSAGGYKLSEAVPDGSGVKLSTESEAYPFYAVTQTEANLENNAGDTADWGMPLIPTTLLTSQALVGWGYGCTDNDCQDVVIGENTYGGSRSVVYVTPVAKCVIKVDVDGDGVVDQTHPAEALQSIKLTDTDNDMTGALIFATTTEESSEAVKVAVAWGQDPSRSGPGDNFALDLGTSVPPLPILEAGKSATIVDDADGNGLVSPGDTLRYTIRVANIGQVDVPAGSWNVIDYELPVFQDTTYVAGSTTYSVVLRDGTVERSTSLADDAEGTPFPLDGAGLASQGTLQARGGTHELSFDTVVVTLENLTPGTLTVENEGIITVPGSNIPVDYFDHSVPLYFPPSSTLVENCRDECTEVMSGGLVPEAVGTACTRMVGDDVQITVSTYKEGCTIYETHVCNLPYVSEEGLDVEQYTLTIPQEEAHDFVCGYDETDYLIAGHATLACDDGTTMAAYFEHAICCNEVIPASESVITPVDDECRTAFAHTSSDAMCGEGISASPSGHCASCFQQISFDRNGYAAFYRWGWTVGGLDLSTDSSYELELWTGADDCDTSEEAAEVVGKAYVTSVGGKVQVSYETSQSFELREAHVYVGTDILPIDPSSGEMTVTPGLYPLSARDLQAPTVSLEADAPQGLAFVIAHAVVCPPGVQAQVLPEPTAPTPVTTAPNAWNGYGRPPSFSPTVAPVEVCDYDCPTNSARVVAAQCPVDFADCTCNAGYEVAGDGISCQGIACGYECPANSNPIDIAVCPASFDDCNCKNNAWRKVGEVCEKICDYDCAVNQPNSEPDPSRTCWSTKSHCLCVAPYQKINNKCQIPT